MKCYVLGAVTGGAENINEIFKIYKKVLETKLTVIGTPLETAKFTGTNKERFYRAEKAIKSVDLIIADMSIVSTGAGIEMGMAYLLGKKILIFAKEGSKISALVKGMVGEDKITYYVNNEDLINKLNAVIF